MSKEISIITKESELFGELRFAIVDDKEYAVGIDVAKALGYADASSIVSKKCKNGIKQLINVGYQNGNSHNKARNTQKMTLIPESDIYRLIFGSKLKEAEKFQDWVFDEVLPSIRKHGAYIGENADENYINNELRFGNKTTIKTFANSDPAMVNKLYSEFKEYIDTEYKDNTKIRKSRYESVEKGVNRLLENLATNVNNIGLCYNVQKLRYEVLSDIKTLTNRVSGGKRAGLTRANKKLKNELDEAKNNALKKEKELIDIKEKYDPNKFWTTLNYHPFSVNYMYDDNQITNAYQKWIDNFPKEKLHSKEEYEQKANIDFNKPIVIYVKYKNLSKFDTDNLSKSLIDYIFNRHLLVDDSIVKGKVEFTQEHCNSYKDGQIRFTLRNMTEDEINRLND